MSCPLCNKESLKEYAVCSGILYLECSNCELVFKDLIHFPTEIEEEKRYLLHHNDVEDINYQRSVLPIIQCITNEQSADKRGLDFGAGPGPVIANLLKNKGYSISLYDPFFHPDISVLDSQYDFIICNEVMEHFHDPEKEFLALRKLLKPDGSLYCMTRLLPKQENFSDWWYKNDSTHVVFYSEKSLQWIQTHFSFSEVRIEGNLIVFRF